MTELSNQWVEENVRPDKDTWLARQAFEAGYSARNGEIEALKDHLDVMIRTNAGHMDAIEELTPKAKAAYTEVNRLSNALTAIRDTQPIGDTPYKYGYAWEQCIMLATIANETIKPDS